MATFFIIIIALLVVTVVAYFSLKFIKASGHKRKNVEFISVNEVFYCDEDNKIISINHNNSKYLILLNKQGHNLLLDKSKEEIINDTGFSPDDGIIVRSERY